MKFTRTPVYGFTQAFPGITNVLISDIVITEAYHPNSGLTPPTGRPFKGIWDTGASGSLISSRVISELGLKPSGKTIVNAVGSGGKVNQYVADTYSINMVLPNHVTIYGVVAAMGEIKDGDSLIGMDVIGTGDFVVTNKDGKTKMSFRTPSIEEIDFVEEINEYNRRYGKSNQSEDEKRRERNRRKAERKKNR